MCICRTSLYNWKIRHQLYFATERGKAGYEKYRNEFAKLILASNYMLLVENVNKMLEAGINVKECQFDSKDEEKVKSGFYLVGYTYKKGLYNELIQRFEEITKSKGKLIRLKKW